MYSDDSNLCVGEEPLFTIEAKSPGCGISAGAKSALDTQDQSRETECQDIIQFNELRDLLAVIGSPYPINKTCQQYLENAQINFSNSLHQAIVQAIISGANSLQYRTYCQLTLSKLSKLGILLMMFCL